MNEEEQQGLELYEDLAAYYDDWKLALKWKWRMLSGYYGGISLAWPVIEEEKVEIELPPGVTRLLHQEEELAVAA